MKKIKEAFQKEGKLLTARSNKPLLLTEDDYVWLVNSGSVDLFSVEIENGEAVGVRERLFRLECGEILFGLNSEKYGKERALLAVGTADSSLLQLNSDRFHELSQEEKFSSTITLLVEKWIGALSLGIRKYLIPKDCLELEACEEVSLNVNENYKSKKGVMWVKHLKGKSAFTGREDFPAVGKDDYFPLSDKAWFRVIDDATLNVINSDNFLKEASFWSYLEKFHVFILDCIITNVKQECRAEEKRIQEKIEDEKNSLKSSILRLSSILRVKREKELITEVTPDPLLSACKIIGKYLKLDFVPYPDSKKGIKSKDPLGDILRASRIRARKVVLKDNWWHQDIGPVLAFKKEDKSPVALVPASSKNLILCDPVSEARTKVTEEAAESLDGFGYTFFPPFPERPLSLKDLLSLGLRRTGKDFIMVAVMGVLAALLGLLIPIATGIIFNTIIPEAASGQLFQIALILIACAVASAVFGITQAIAMLRIEGKADFSMQAALWDRVLMLPPPFFRNYTAGDLAVRSLGVNAIRQILSGAAVQSILGGIFSVFYLALLFHYHRKLALIAAAIGLFTVIFTSTLSYFNVRYQKPMSDIEGKISGLMLQFITGIAKLRITGTEDRAFAVWANKFSSQKKISLKANTIENIHQTFNSILPVLSSIIIFYFVISKVMKPGQAPLSIGNFLAFMSAYGIFQSSFIQLTSTLVSSLNVIPYYNRLKPILQELPEVDKAKAKPSEITGNIETNQVYFRYKPDGPLILMDISLKIDNGEFVALVGSSGSGKSTLMRHLLGFETPESGSIYYDGQDLSTIDVTEIRRQIGVVLQNSQIMQGSIYENIAGSSTGQLTINDAWEAARMAGCYDDINEMPMKMHTILPPGGGTLSGGQRQRILIARAIIKKPRILIFDEATSALDNRTQEIVSESIEKLHSTRIVIAHRLSTIMHADRIYVMDKGRIVQVGTYDELINQEGLFKELAKRQLE